jgi:hypothetical protein
MFVEDPDGSLLVINEWVSTASSWSPLVARKKSPVLGVVQLLVAEAVPFVRAWRMR